MLQTTSRRALAALRAEGLGLRELVDSVAVVVFLAQLAWRAWIVVPGWFYADDLLLLEDAQRPLHEVLLVPNDSQLMPLGRVVADLVELAGPYAWWAAALTILVGSALATASCWVMLRVTFGAHPFVLVPFVLFCFSPLAADATSWWAVALNALPAQAAFFVVVTGFVMWSRTRERRWILVVTAAFLLGAASGPRALLMALPVGFFVILFCSGTGPGRVRRVVARHWPVVTPLAALGVGYLALYRDTTPAPVRIESGVPWLAVADNLVVSALLPGLLGGPWRWDLVADPIAVPDPSTAMRVLAVVVTVALLAVAWRRHPSTTWRALVVVAAQLGGTYVAIALGRALQLGAEAGLFTRYVPDVLAVLALAVPAAVLQVQAPGAPRAEARRPVPRRARPVLAVGLAAVLAASVANAAMYALPWHRDYPAKQYVANVRASMLEERRAVADLEVPELVQLRLHYPRNLPSHVLAPYGDLVDARMEGNDLAVIDADGTVRPASVRGAGSAPGPEPGCGTRVTAGRPATLRLDRDSMTRFPWTSLSYAASADGEATVTFDGRATFPMRLLSGPHTYLVNGDGPYTELEIEVDTPGVVLCVDRAEAGALGAVR
ncbi:hypothetical protein [Aeromicrobium sp.]|uniref:hypothetical protein n=1 Tax=Aeromicrobium sp. TaxID=1871063 RepID=UPI004034B6E7